MNFPSIIQSQILLTQAKIWNGDEADRIASWKRTVLHFREFGTPEQLKMALLLARNFAPKMVHIRELPRGNRLIRVTERVSEAFL